MKKIDFRTQVERVCTVLVIGLLVLRTIHQGLRCVEDLDYILVLATLAIGPIPHKERGSTQKER